MQEHARAGPIGQLRQLREQLTPDDESRIFVCHACIRSRRRNRLLPYLAFALAAGAALLRGWIADGRL